MLYRVSQKTPPMLLEWVETWGHCFGTPSKNFLAPCTLIVGSWNPDSDAGSVHISRHYRPGEECHRHHPGVRPQPGQEGARAQGGEEEG